jgi:hypothetical protein
MEMCCTAASACGPRQANVAHVADVEDARAGAHRHVLVDDAAADGRGILHGHVPAVELDHLRAHLAMDGVERCLADGSCDDGGRRLNGMTS